jgi:hypothetical protein
VEHVTALGYDPADMYYSGSCSCGEDHRMFTWGHALAWRNLHDPANARPQDGPYPSWHIPGLCHNSAALRARHEPRPSEYWHLAPNGYWFAHCAGCCATARQLGTEEPCLAPLRVCTA